MKTVFKLARLSAAVVVLALGLAHPTSVAHATTGATLTVNSNLDADVADGICTLREAITAAGNNADYHGCVNTGGVYGDDIIQFSIPGSTVITLSAALPIIYSLTGALTIQGSNAGRPVVIDGAGAYQVFNVSGGTLTLANLTVQHAFSSGAGGGVLNSGTLIVLKSTFRNNTADSAGAIHNMFPGNLTVVNSTFYGNNDTNGGAVVNNSGTAAILNSTFSGNSSPMYGGALSTWNGGSGNPVTHVYNTILANSSGGAVDCWNFSGSTLTGSNNIVETSASAGSSCSAITTSASDPKLGALTGAPAYFPLQVGSPAIDAGSNTTCASAPAYNASQNAVPRPQDGNNDTVRTCDIGSYEKPVVFNARSSGAQDGWVLESSETSGIGGSTKDATATTLRVGDDAGDRQYRAILSFPTASLPDTAVIQSVTLKVKKNSQTGALNPVTALLGFQPDVQRGFFGAGTGLESADFQFHNTATGTVGPFSPALLSGWYTLNLTGAKAYVNKLSTNGGVTQVRLRFHLDDNDNLAANYLSLYSGNALTPADRPLLGITYYVP